MSDGTRYVRNPDVVTREEDEWAALLFNPDTGDTRFLNTTARVAWALLDGEHTCEGIAAELADQFEGAEQAKIQEDVADLLEDLLKAGFIGLQEPAQVP